MTPRELGRAVAAGNIAPIYFLCGDNRLLLDEAIVRITAAVVPDQAAGLDVHQFTAQTHSPSEILQAVRTVPFCSARKLVLVRDAHLLKAPQWKPLHAACAKPAPRCCLVFVLHLDTREKKDRDRIKALHGHGAVVVFENPRGEKDVGLCMTQELARHGKKITPEALSLLSGLLEEDAQAIAQEMHKLALFCGSRAIVALEDAEEVVSRGVRGTLFTLVDAIMQGRIDAALPLLGSLKEAGTHPLVMLKILARQFRLVSTAQEQIGRGAGGDIRQALLTLSKIRLPEQAIAAIHREARAWPAGSMSRVFNLLFETGMLLKSSRSDGGIILEQLVLRLSALRAQARAAA